MRMFGVYHGNFKGGKNRQIFYCACNLMKNLAHSNLGQELIKD